MPEERRTIWVLAALYWLLGGEPDWRRRGAYADLAKHLYDLGRQLRMVVTKVEKEKPPTGTPGTGTGMPPTGTPGTGTGMPRTVRPLDLSDPWGPTERTVQPKLDASCASRDATGATVESALRTPGEPLDRALRARLEPRLGRDLGHIRVHTHPVAAASARALGALAYASGSRIVFASGRYAPRTVDGERLIAHEVVHAVQQGGAGASGRVPAPLARPDDAAEREADRAADALVSGATPVPVLATVRPMIARQPGGKPGSCHVTYDGASLVLRTWDAGSKAFKDSVKVVTGLSVAKPKPEQR